MNTEERAAEILRMREKKMTDDQPKIIETQKEVFICPACGKSNPDRICDCEKNLYGAILGEKNRIYYLTKFEQFDQQGPGLKASWNWPAFFCINIWALYRKMYGYFFALWGITILSKMIEKGGYPILGGFVFIVPWILFTVFANSLYHATLSKKITFAQNTIKNEQRLLEYLRNSGGVNTWAIWFLVIPAIAVLAAITIPMFAGQPQTKQSQNMRLGTPLNGYSEPDKNNEAPRTTPAPISAQSGKALGYDPYDPDPTNSLAGLVPKAIPYPKQSETTPQSNLIDGIDMAYDVNTSRNKSATRQEYINTLGHLVPDWQEIRDLPQFSEFLSRRLDFLDRLDEILKTPVTERRNSYRDCLIEGDNNMDPVRVAEFYNAFKREYGSRSR